jgi:hypothetical protein
LKLDIILQKWFYGHWPPDIIPTTKMPSLHLVSKPIPFLVKLGKNAPNHTCSTKFHFIVFCGICTMNKEVL